MTKTKIRITGTSPAFSYYTCGVEAIENSTCINCGQKAKRGQTLDWFIGKEKTIFWHWDSFNCPKPYNMKEKE